MGSWTSRTERTVSARIPAEPARVRAFYVDLDNMRTVHPLVRSVHTLRRDERADGYTQTYAVVDRVPFGRLGLPIRYTARLTVPSAGDVIADVRQFPRVRLHTVVSFEPCDGATLLTERMRIEAPRPLAGITVRQAVDAHRQLLARIAAQFGE